MFVSLSENKERLASAILIGNKVANISATALNRTLAIQIVYFLGFGEIAPKSLKVTHNRCNCLR
ncbi:MAG: hypothetical protein HQ517_03900 [SAR324 cluster bacterium]|nr:hypothetical protein [SAR324 cluster bacterium]